MKGYYLVQNIMFNAKHIVKQRWYHRFFGEPSMTIDFTKAVSKEVAYKKFKLRGHNFGMLER